MNNYTVKPFRDKQELDSYRNLFLDSESKDKSPEFLDWLHYQNILQTQMIDFAVDTNETAAMVASLPQSFLIKNQIFKSLQYLDVITHSKHRGKGLFNLLANSLYDRASLSQFDFIYGFPNANTAKGYFTKMNWSEIGEVPFIMKVFRPAYFVKKIFKTTLVSKLTPNFSIYFPKKISLPSNFSIRQINSFTSEYNTIWENFSKNFNVSINRDADFLNWRINKKPNESYITYSLFSNETPVAFITQCVKEKHNGRIGYIIEFMFIEEFKNQALQLLRHSINSINQQKADVILGWCFNHSPNWPLFKKLSFFQLPEKFRPIKLFFGAKSINQNITNDIYTKQNWYLSYCDSDTV